MMKFKKTETIEQLVEFFNATEKVAKSPIDCFENPNHFYCMLDEFSPANLLPFNDFDYFALEDGERSSFLISHDFTILNDELIFLISLNENYYPTGQWMMVTSRVIETSTALMPTMGLEQGYSLVEFERES
jgi:hypothetical protein